MLALGAAAFLTSPAAGGASLLNQDEKKQASHKSESEGPALKPPSPDDELRQTVDQAGSDRVALVRNLEEYLKRYPETRHRLEIYRALVEAGLQLRDSARSADYAERIVALSPGDVSMTMIAIQLLQGVGKEDGLRRATTYAARLLDYVQRESAADKSPKVSQEEWEAERRQSRMTVLVLRGRLYSKLKDAAAATRDFEESYALVPNATAAEELGEIAELQKNLPKAITEYARAFVLAGTGADSNPNRLEVRRKLGNVWRLAHGAETGLGEFLLRTYDATLAEAAPPQTKRNPGPHDFYQHTMRLAPDGKPLPLRNYRGHVLTLNFWATWCGPCRALEPQFERVASQFKGKTDVMFIAVNCDEDEALVAEYLKEAKMAVPVAFADGLAELMGVQAFPTVMVIDRAGKIAYRSDGYGDEEFENKLAESVRSALAAVPSLQQH